MNLPPGHNFARLKKEALAMLDSHFDNSVVVYARKEDGSYWQNAEGLRHVSNIAQPAALNPDITVLQYWNEELLALEELDMQGKLAEEDRPLYEALQEFMRRRTGG
jgi:hypothetical protein